jgi:hypothetical protein
MFTHCADIASMRSRTAIHPCMRRAFTHVSCRSHQYLFHVCVCAVRATTGTTTAAAAEGRRKEGRKEGRKEACVWLVAHTTHTAHDLQAWRTRPSSLPSPCLRSQTPPLCPRGVLSAAPPACLLTALHRSSLSRADQYHTPPTPKAAYLSPRTTALSHHGDTRTSDVVVHTGVVPSSKTDVAVSHAFSNTLCCSPVQPALLAHVTTAHH